MLIGEGGVDYLLGGQGDDVLLGGLGDDFYYFRPSDGQDIVVDEDGQGTLIRGSRQPAAGIATGVNQWVAEGTTYSRTGADLEITFADNATDKITIKNFDFAPPTGTFLGIQLMGAPTTPVITGSTFNDRLIISHNPNAAFTFASNIASQNGVPYDATVSILVPGVTNLIIEGGAGRDVLTTQVAGNGIFDEFDSGDDIIYAGVEADFLNLNAQPATGQGGDLLSGLAGRDVLVGSAGRDLLFGGNDGDVLWGGADDDALFGDDGVSDANSAFNSDWGFRRDPLDPTSGELFASGGAYFFVMPGHRGGADQLIGGAGDDTLFGQAGADVIEGGTDNDVLVGGAGDDKLFGGNENDILYGDATPVNTLPIAVGEGYNLSGIFAPLGSQEHTIVAPGLTTLSAAELIGNDYLDGGEGIDTLVGGAGDDTYFFDAGDGADTLSDESGDDTLRLGAGIALADISFAGTATGQVQSLVMTIGSAGDSITLVDEFRGIDIVQFASGASYILDELAQATGGVQLSGSDADDTLNSLGSYVVLAGGKGNDTQLGGTEGTTYLFNPGDGADFINDAGGVDTIAFGQGISSNDISWRYDPSLPGGRFTLEVGTSGDEIAIANGEQGAIERFRFFDGSTLSFDSLLSRQGGLPTAIAPTGLIFDGGSEDYVSYLAGSPGPDFLYDFDVGHVTYAAGRGDDYLEIYQGDGYRYIFNIGDGHDVINADNGADETIVFGPGVTPDSVRFALTTQSYRRYDQYAIDPFPMYTDEGLSISYGDQGDSVFVVYGSYAYSSFYEIENFEFADGQTFSYAELLKFAHPGPLTPVGQANGVTLTAGDDVYAVFTDSSGTWIGSQGEDVSALGGDDLVIGGGGHDIFDGGGGHDILQGGAGEDELYADYSYTDSANDLLDGGDGFDYIDASLGNDLLIGGRGDDLIVETGHGEHINLYDWYYEDVDDRTLSKLQIIVDSGNDYDPGSADPLLNRRVQVFDFVEIVR